MIPFTITVPSKTPLNTVVQLNCKPNSNTTILENRTAFVNSLVGGAIVQGNFVDPNSFSYTKSEFEHLKGVNYRKEWYNTCNWNLRSCTGYIAINSNNYLFGNTTFPSDLYNLALSRFNEKVRGSLDLSVALFEAGKTAKMINIIKRIREYSGSSGWRALIRGASNARAESMFGWRPLIGDLYGVLDESQNIILDQISSLKGRASRPINDYAPQGLVDTKFGQWPYNARRQGKYACEIKCAIKTGGFDISRWASLNPVSWAYELTPYSFVLDYLINVGGYLRNLETSLLYDNTFVSGYVSKLVAMKSSATIDKIVVSGSNPVGTNYVQGTMGGRYINFARTKLSSYPVPDLPSFKVDLGANQLFNLAALLGQRMKG